MGDFDLIRMTGDQLLESVDDYRHMRHCHWASADPQPTQKSCEHDGSFSEGFTKLAVGVVCRKARRKHPSSGRGTDTGDHARVAPCR
jgi:hypothetical protein